VRHHRRDGGRADANLSAVLVDEDALLNDLLNLLEIVLLVLLGAVVEVRV
jgi:hypothetical protein